ncbi:MAG TPA: gamma-glutamyltransferase [Burkholderiales bacterium]|jgi:gamma-glutamyltranspeptidase/glutathione hydrolase|nr:gamma-glutamyltransferase [Burkholderiales bacterium]
MYFRAAFAAVVLVFVASCAQFRGQETGGHFVVAAAHPLAVDAGYAVLERGGSALDAAIAVQMVLGLVEPESSGIGGGAFVLYWSESDKRLRSYDGRETAPAAARADRFLREDKTPMGFMEAVVGGRSVGVPGVLRMLELAHAKHGRLPWSELFQPAIATAEAGFPLSPRLHAQLEREPFLPKDAAARSIFYEDGKAKPVGARIVNAQYAATLRTIAKEGVDAFYRGEIARDIVRAVESNARPGDLTEQDLAGYRALEREPLCGPYRQWRVCSMAPPSAGGIAVLQILGILERTTFARAPPLSAEAVHLFSEAGRLAYADRAKYVGDPDFFSVPTKKLVDAQYLEKRAGLIGERSMRTAVPGDTEAAGTSHISIVDAQGNVASMTTTIEATFGSRIMVRGFLLNNELTDFDFTPGSANEIAPGKRPRSSMAPTIVFASDGAVRLAVGSPGGPNIINYVAKSLVAMLDWGRDAQAAAAAPNFGSRNGPTLLEAGSFYEAMKGALEARGHTVEANPLTSGVHAVERVPGGWRGGADPRREGTVRGN